MVQELIIAVEKADSSDGLLEATEALAASCEKDAIPTLIEILGFNNPGAAVAAVEGLIALGEVAVPYLLENLDGYNYGARAWAIRALAGIGDPRALDLLLKAASSDFALSVRRAATKGLGIIRWSNLSLNEVKFAQVKVLETLLFISETDPEWVVRYSAVVALESLFLVLDQQNFELKQQVLDKLQVLSVEDNELVVCARAQMAIEEIKKL